MDFELFEKMCRDDYLSKDEVFRGLVDHGLFHEKLPQCFNSEGLTAHLPNSFSVKLNDSKNARKKITEENTHDYIRTSSQRDTNVSRTVGVPHPESHLKLSEAIRLNWSELFDHHCAQVPKFSQIHVRPFKSGAIFKMTYKGFEKYATEEAEITWASESEYKVCADISSCFPSIYTHSIPWALHGKARIKSGNNRHDRRLTGNLLDACSQGQADKQTSGIPIGPHTSNILSEIILNTVDKSLQDRGYLKVVRNIDDYTYFASSRENAEEFLRDLSLSLREFELSLNEKKTKFQRLPAPSHEDWVLELQRFRFSESEGEIRFSEVRQLLELAAELSVRFSKQTPYLYALKMIPETINERAKKLLTIEATGLALKFPYLVSQLEETIFTKFQTPETPSKIKRFANQLFERGHRKLATESILYSLYYALKYGFELDGLEEKSGDLVALEDCMILVLLRRYAIAHRLKKVKDRVRRFADKLKVAPTPEQDRQWLLVYEIWTPQTLANKGQSFLSDLKSAKMKFLKFP